MAKSVTVYTTPVCSQCTMTKSWLTREGVEFTTVDITTSPDDAAAVKELGYASAPVVIVGNGDTAEDKHWYGFRPDLLKEFAL